MSQPQVPQALAPAAGTKSGMAEIPAPQEPICTRVWAHNPLEPAQGPVWWQYGQDHPFVKEFKIVRMIVLPGGAVEVYSSNYDPKGASCLRHTIPWGHVLMVEEAMGPQVFVQELVAAESDEEVEDDEPEEPEASPGEALEPLTPSSGSTNGAPSS